MNCVYMFWNQFVCVYESFQLNSQRAFFPFSDFYFPVSPDICVGVVDYHPKR